MACAWQKARLQKLLGCGRRAATRGAELVSAWQRVRLLGCRRCPEGWWQGADDADSTQRHAATRGAESACAGQRARLLEAGSIQRGGGKVSTMLAQLKQHAEELELGGDGHLFQVVLYGGRRTRELRSVFKTT